MYKSGKVDAATAMQMLAEISCQDTSSTQKGGKPPDSRKRARSPSPDCPVDELDDIDLETQPGENLDSLLFFGLLTYKCEWLNLQ